MHSRHPVRWLMWLSLGLAAPPVFALGAGGLAGDTAELVERQVEQRAERLVEDAIVRQVETRLEMPIEPPNLPLPALPRTVSVPTESGTTAFREIRTEGDWRAVERQWLLTGTAETIANLSGPDIEVLERQSLPGLGLTVVRFRVTPALDSREALARRFPALVDRFDRNHVYTPQTTTKVPGETSLSPRWRTLCTDPVRVGMVDGAIDAGHPTLRGADLVQRRFLATAPGRGALMADLAHGTAVASLMVGQREGQWPARLPSATVVNAAALYDRGDLTAGATLGHLLAALDWLAGQSVAVINLSLTGPDNRVLAAAIRSLLAQDVLLVAAVGNEGPTARPLYPAAYPGVIGVTAVDEGLALYRWANQGDQVMFAARGVRVPVAHPKGGMVADSGTSLAAPVVTALLACRRVSLAPERAVQALIDEARDLGAEGRDPRFGHGFLDG